MTSTITEFDKKSRLVVPGFSAQELDATIDEGSFNADMFKKIEEALKRIEVRKEEIAEEMRNIPESVRQESMTELKIKAAENIIAEILAYETIVKYRNAITEEFIVAFSPDEQISLRETKQVFNDYLAHEEKHITKILGYFGYTGIVPFLEEACEKSNNYNKALVLHEEDPDIVRAYTHGFTLFSMADLPNGDAAKAKKAGVYIAEDGSYLVCDLKRKLHRGSLLQAGVFTLSELSDVSSKLDDFDFRDKVLKLTFENGHTPAYLTHDIPLIRCGKEGVFLLRQRGFDNRSQKKGYKLRLMSCRTDKGHEDKDDEIYIDEKTREYVTVHTDKVYRFNFLSGVEIFENFNSKVITRVNRGILPESIDISNLPSRLNETRLKRDILSFTKEKGHTNSTEENKSEVLFFEASDEVNAFIETLPKQSGLVEDEDKAQQLTRGILRTRLELGKCIPPDTSITAKWLAKKMGGDRDTLHNFVKSSQESFILREPLLENLVAHSLVLWAKLKFYQNSSFAMDKLRKELSSKFMEATGSSIGQDLRTSLVQLTANKRAGLFLEMSLIAKKLKSVDFWADASKLSLTAEKSNMRFNAIKVHGRDSKEFEKEGISPRSVNRLSAIATSVISNTATEVSDRINSVIESIQKGRFFGAPTHLCAEMSYFDSVRRAWGVVQDYQNANKGDASTEGWKLFRKRSNGTRTEQLPSRKISKHFRKGSPAEIYQKDELVCTITPQKLERDGEKEFSGVGIEMHRHQEKDMALAVRMMAASLIGSDKNEICITVDLALPGADELVLQYADAILAQCLTPIFCDKGIALDQKETKAKLIELVSVMKVKGNHCYDNLVERYDAHIEMEEATKKEDKRFLSAFDQFLKESSRSLSLRTPMPYFVQDAIKEPELLYGEKIMARLAQIFKNRNLTTYDFVDKIVNYAHQISPNKEMLVTPKKLEKLKQKLRNYIDGCVSENLLAITSGESIVLKELAFAKEVFNMAFAALEPKLDMDLYEGDYFFSSQRAKKIELQVELASTPSDAISPKPAVNQKDQNNLSIDTALTADDDLATTEDLAFSDLDNTGNESEEEEAFSDDSVKKELIQELAQVQEKLDVEMLQMPVHSTVPAQVPLPKIHEQEKEQLQRKNAELLAKIAEQQALIDTLLRKVEQSSEDRPEALIENPISLTLANAFEEQVNLPKQNVPEPPPLPAPNLNPMSKPSTEKAKSSVAASSNTPKSTMDLLAELTKGVVLNPVAESASADRQLPPQKPSFEKELLAKVLKGASGLNRASERELKQKPLPQKPETDSRKRERELFAAVKRRKEARAFLQEFDTLVQLHKGKLSTENHAIIMRDPNTGEELDEQKVLVRLAEIAPINKGLSQEDFLERIIEFASISLSHDSSPILTKEKKAELKTMLQQKIKHHFDTDESERSSLDKFVEHMVKDVRASLESGHDNKNSFWKSLTPCLTPFGNLCAGVGNGSTPVSDKAIIESITPNRGT